jgi:hypothetical protein
MIAAEYESCKSRMLSGSLAGRVHSPTGAHTIVAVRVAWGEAAIAHAIKAAGGH